MKRIKDRISDDTFITTCKSSLSMAEAAVKLNIHFNSFKKRAIELGVYLPNPSGKGKSKNMGYKYSTQDILDGKCPQLQTYKIKLRLLKEGILRNECYICNTSMWLNKTLNLELDHINGIRSDHSINNLRILCPNCHSQTSTFRSKNR